jgi:chemotaxis protein CheY-P-specific phosphatase CheC
MSLEVMTQIEEVFCMVCEELAFMFGEPTSVDELPAELPGAVVATITFHGPMSGVLELAGPRELAFGLATNILGLDEVDDEAQAMDAIGEALNVCCGQVLTAAFGDELAFDLTPPEVNADDAAGWSSLRGESGVSGFIVDDMPVLLRLTVQTDERTEN